MMDPNFTILYVDNPPHSAAFYDNGTRFGLWSRHTVEPAANASPGSVEIAFAVGDRTEVTRLHDTWTQRGLPIAQNPTAMDFGYTFVALDPDGHRLRVFTPEG